MSGLIIDISLFAYIFSIYFFSNRTGPHIISNVLAVLLTVLICVKMIREKKKPMVNTYLLAFLSFVIISWLSYFVAIDKGMAMKMLKTLSAIYVFTFILSQYLDSYKKAERVYTYVFISGLLASIYVLLSMGNSESMRLGRVLGHQNVVGLLIGSSFLFGVYKLIFDNMKFSINNNYFYIISNIIMFTTIVLTGSRRAVIFSVLGAVILMFLRYRKNNAKLIKIFLLTGVFVAIFFLVVTQVSFLYKIIGIRFEHMIDFVLGRPITKEFSIPMRDYMIRFGMDLFKDRPLLGHGINNYRVLLGEAKGWNTYAHNNLVELLVGTGIIGVLAYYSIYAVTFYALSSKARIRKGASKNTPVPAFSPVFYVFQAWMIASIIVESLTVQYYSKIFYIILAAGWATLNIQKNEVRNMSNSKKVCFLSETLANGGSEKAIAGISANLSLKFNKTIILYDGSKIEYPYKGGLMDLKSYPGKSIFGKAVTFINRVYAISTIKDEKKFDTVISFMDSLNIANIITARDERVIVSVRNDLCSKPKDCYAFLRNIILRIMYKQADIVVAVSKGLERQLMKKYNIPREKLKVICNGLDLENLKKEAKQDIELKWRQVFSHPCVVTVGRLTNQKGQWHLIRAFKKVKQTVKDAKLIILGEGELNETLKDIVEELGLREDIHFLGFKKNPHKYVSRADVFVLSSLYEGFPNSLLEAMAVSTPIISTCCRTGPVEILEPSVQEDKKLESAVYAEYGVIIPELSGVQKMATEELEKEELILAEAMVKMLKDEPVREYYKLKSLERAMHYDIKNMIKEWEDII